MSSALEDALRQALGDRVVPADEGLTLLAGSEKELIQIVRLLRDHPPEKRVRIARGAMVAPLNVDPHSLLVEVGAGMRLARLEQALSLHELTLGPLTPQEQGLDVAGWLEGPWAGLRSIQGGRLESACVSLSAVMADGLVFTSKAAPRRAAGPDLGALFLGGGGVAGLLTQATLRVFPKNDAPGPWALSFSSHPAATATIRAAVAEGLLVARARLAPTTSGVTLHLWPFAQGPARTWDEAGLHRLATQRGGGAVQGTPPPSRREGAEAELSWPQIDEALGRGQALWLWRVSLQGAIVQGAMGIGLPLGAQAWEWQGSTPLALVAEQVDPARTLRGPR